MSDTKTQACQWKYCESECSWDTQCDNKYQFINDGPKENDYKFCPGCGKPVTLAGDEQPASVEPEELKTLPPATGSAFDVWWHNEGSGMPPKAGEDAETHVRRICEIAWSNGAYKTREEVLNLRTEVNCRIEHGAESGRHLEYVQTRLDAILTPNAPHEPPPTGDSREPKTL